MGRIDSGRATPGSGPGVSVAVGAGSLALYLWLAPGVSGHGDSSELTLVLALNGVTHPTGYPIYTLLGHWFASALHALGMSWSMAANTWSAAGAAVALGLLHRLGVRLVPSDPGRPAPPWSVFALLPVALLLLNPGMGPGSHAGRGQLLACRLGAGRGRRVR